MKAALLLVEADTIQAGVRDQGSGARGQRPEIRENLKTKNRLSKCQSAR